ncbi:MAG: hypothetical protein PHT88_00400 [Candidatus Moranbacteria bacterium]|nr:hypothetical protein [Candidatus Moranbacteria bacterium]
MTLFISEVEARLQEEAAGRKSGKGRHQTRTPGKTPLVTWGLPVQQLKEYVAKRPAAATKTVRIMNTEDTFQQSHKGRGAGLRLRNNVKSWYNNYSDCKNHL